MNRFLKTLTLLIVSLFLVVSGVDAALDRLAHSVGQNSFTLYNEKGDIVVAYNGNLALCKACPKPGLAAAPRFLHRTKASASDLSPAFSDSSSRWF